MENDEARHDEVLSSSSSSGSVDAFSFLMNRSRRKEDERGASNSIGIVNRNRQRNRKRARPNDGPDDDGARSSSHSAAAAAATSGSRFVSCPYCSKSFSRAFVRAHVETCPANAEYQEQEEARRERKKAEIFRRHRATIGTTSNAANNETVVTPDNDAFRKMMDQSKRCWNFGEANQSDGVRFRDDDATKRRRQRFHLTADMDVVWIADDETGNDEDAAGRGRNSRTTKADHHRLLRDGDDIRWSSSIISIRASKIDDETDRGGDDVELRVTSSIPPSAAAGTPRAPFVRDHSRLSIPVLKSILQKSVRRRRPLPSVKVAMELSDKNLGELLRRLPIICIEDSTLHHDFPFLVWLLVAESKNFQPTRPMMIRLFRDVFEIASCPWKDSFDDAPPANVDKDPNETSALSLTAMSRSTTCAETTTREENDDARERNGDAAAEGRSILGGRDLLVIRSILLRHKYGGMSCDLKLLQSAARAWQHRFANERVVDPRLARSCLPQCCDGGDGATDRRQQIRWRLVPELLHPVGRSLNAVLPLLARPLPYLKYADVTPAGVDFHCSNVLDVPLYNVGMQSRIQELYSGEGGATKRSLSVQEIGALLKKACWDHCSGVNHRRGFRSASSGSSADGRHQQEGAEGGEKDEQERIRNVWNFVAPSVQTFARNYLSRRMVHPPGGSGRNDDARGKRSGTKSKECTLSL